MPKEYEIDGDAPPRRTGEDGARVNFGRVEANDPQPVKQESPEQSAARRNRFQAWLNKK